MQKYKIGYLKLKWFMDSLKNKEEFNHYLNK